MRIPSGIFAIFLSVVAHGVETLRVGASDAHVHECPPRKPGVYVDRAVHAPAQFHGLPLRCSLLVVRAGRSDAWRSEIGDEISFVIPVQIELGALPDRSIRVEIP